MSQRKTRLQRIGAACGILTPVLAFTCILTAIASYSAFSWTRNALSDLGVVSGITGLLFNFGLYSSGFLIFIFAAFGLFTYLGTQLVGKIGATFFAATGAALVGIACFPENMVPYHYLFSVAFFVLLPISLLVITGAFVLGRQAKMALFTLLTAVVAALPWILYFYIQYAPGVAIPESISGLAGSVWTVVLGYKMPRAASTKIWAQQHDKKLNK